MAPNAVKPIDTLYGSHRFRSRLEARWAVFFNALKIPFEYEREGYGLSSGPYLPDFWLPTEDCFVEIKGGDPTEHEQQLAHELAIATNKKVFIFYGPLETQMASDGSALLLDSLGYDSAHKWCSCPICGAYTIQFSGIYGARHCGDDWWRTDTSREDAILAAYMTASRARFEYGAIGR